MTESDSARFKLTAVFTGRVQGVGFRMTTVEIARDFQVSGGICNVSNGTVEMKAYGEQEELFRFLKAIQQRFSRNIVQLSYDMEEQDGDAAGGGCEGFRVQTDKIV